MSELRSNRGSPSRRALYVSHTGMSEPLGHSQVVPYLRGLARRGWGIDLVCFEPAQATAEDLARLGDELAGDGIGYHATRRSPSHAPAVKLVEATRAFAQLAVRAFARGGGPAPSVIHARSDLPAIVARALSSLRPGLAFLYDCRGLLADEYVDAGHWARGSLRYRVLRRIERHLFARADAVVTLSDRLRGWLRAEGWVDPSQTVEVIPCCVDTERFRPDGDARREWRARLGLGDEFVLGYAGALNSWYGEEEMARLYLALRRRRKARFVVYTRGDAERLRSALARSGLDGELVVRAVVPREMPRALTALDAALSFVQPCFSKIASSPTKVAEYLAVGVPVVMGRGVGDGDALIDEEPAVLDAGRMSELELERVAEELATRDLAPLREPARRAAIARFSVESVGVARYARLYEQLGAPPRRPISLDDARRDRQARRVAG